MKGFINTVLILVAFVFCERFPMTEEMSSVGYKTGLTTAKLRGSGLLKPMRTYYVGGRRFDYIEQSAAPVNGVQILRSREGESERDSEGSKEDNVWDWDFWCQLQPDTGECSSDDENRGSMTRNYFYDAVVDACKPFRYSRCNGNKNNFQTLIECERHCKDAVYMTLKETTDTSSCALQPNAGSCIALFQRYYYDVRSGECKRFTYGGCGGNQNRFDTVEQCNRRCKPIN